MDFLIAQNKFVEPLNQLELEHKLGGLRRRSTPAGGR